MNSKIFMVLAPVGAMFAFNAFNASKAPMQDVAGEWSCTATQPDGPTLQIRETLNIPGNAWGSVTNTIRAPDGEMVKVVVGYQANWSAGSDTITHRYGKATLVSARAGNEDMTSMLKDAADKQSALMRGKTRTSHITLLSKTELRYENADARVACERVEA